MVEVMAGFMVVLAGVLHGWFGGNANATPGNAAAAFYHYGKVVLLATIVLLISGLIIFWFSAGILVAVAIGRHISLSFRL